jgi:hypothetical protein
MRTKIPYLACLICACLLTGCGDPQMAGAPPEPYDPDRADCIWYSALDDLLFEHFDKHFFLTPTQVAERKEMLDPCAMYASSMRQWRVFEGR